MFGVHIKYILLSELITTDFATAIVEVLTESAKRHLIIASAYFSGHQNIYRQRKLKASLDCVKMGPSISFNVVMRMFITSQDEGSTNNSVRGEYLVEYLPAANIAIVSRGIKATFINAVRKEILYLTLADPFITNNIKNLTSF